MEITKEQLIFSRGEGGSLIPQAVALESVKGKPTVKVIPLTRGRLQEIYQSATSTEAAEKIKADNDVIKYGLISPELSDEDIEYLKPQMALAITQAILSVSLGLSQEEIGEKTKEVVEKQELVLSKK